MANKLINDVRNATSNEVVTKRDGNSFELWTKTRTGIEKEQNVLRNRGETAPNWNDITIDHVIPLENVLREHVEQINGLRLLSQKFAEFNGENGSRIDGRKDYWVNALYEHERYHDELNNDNLRRQLERDLENIAIWGEGLQLMDSKANTQKGKRRRRH